MPPDDEPQWRAIPLIEWGEHYKGCTIKMIRKSNIKIYGKPDDAGPEFISFGDDYFDVLASDLLYWDTTRNSPKPRWDSEEVALAQVIHEASDSTKAWSGMSNTGRTVYCRMAREAIKWVDEEKSVRCTCRPCEVHTGRCC